MLLRNGVCLALAGWLGLAAGPAWGEQISLSAAIERSLARHPGLRAEGYAVTAAQQQARLDGLAPAPSFAADLENIAGSGTLRGVHGAETTLRLSQVWERGGKREARQARGNAEVERQQNVLAQRRLDLAAETTRRYIALALAQHALALARQQRALVHATAAAVRERVERGVAAAADAALAQIEAVRGEIAQEHAEHELTRAQFALAVLWGESAAVAVEATGDLLSLPELPAFDPLAAKLAQTPEAAAFALEARRLAADRALASAAARPDLALSLGVRRLEALDDQGLVLSLAVPFGTAQRSAYALARSDAEQSALAARQQAAMLEARQQLFAHYQELRHARTEFIALGERMIPAAEQGVALTRAGYDEARYSLLQLNQAQATLLQLRQERLAAAARYHQLLADIERSTAATGAQP